MEITAFFLLKMEELNDNYNNISFVGYSNMYIANKKDMNILKKKYNIHLIDDRGNYEKTVMYKYRVDYRMKMNYFLIFDEKGYLLEKYIN